MWNQQTHDKDNGIDVVCCDLHVDLRKKVCSYHSKFYYNKLKIPMAMNSDVQIDNAINSNKFPHGMFQIEVFRILQMNCDCKTTFDNNNKVGPSEEFNALLWRNDTRERCHNWHWIRLVRSSYNRLNMHTPILARLRLACARYINSYCHCHCHCHTPIINNDFPYFNTVCICIETFLVEVILVVSTNLIY